MFSANVCSGGLSDIGSHPHFMTKGRGDSTNSLETHVNLVQRLNKQSDICKRDNSANLKSNERIPPPFHPLQSRFLWQSCQLNHFIFSIRIIWPRHQNSELIPLKAGFLRGDLFKPVNSFSDQTLLPPPTCDQYGLVNEYSNISWVPVIIYGVAVITVITIFSSSSPPL